MDVMVYMVASLVPRLFRVGGGSLACTAHACTKQHFCRGVLQMRWRKIVGVTDYVRGV